MSQNTTNLTIALSVLVLLIGWGVIVVSLGSARDTDFDKWCADRDMTVLRRSGQLYCHRADGALFYPVDPKS